MNDTTQIIVHRCYQFHPRAYIDNFIHNCDPSFNNKENHLYIIDNRCFESKMDTTTSMTFVDDRIKYWTVDSILSINYINTSDLIAKSIWGSPVHKGIIVIYSRNYQTKKMKKAELQKAKSKLSYKSIADLPVLFVDKKIIPAENSTAYMAIIKLKDISNITFYDASFSTTKCIADRETKNGVIQIWLKEHDNSKNIIINKKKLEWDE